MQGSEQIPHTGERLQCSLESSRQGGRQRIVRGKKVLDAAGEKNCI
jgi:hypothetical protein